MTGAVEVQPRLYHDLFPRSRSMRDWQGRCTLRLCMCCTKTCTINESSTSTHACKRTNFKVCRVGIVDLRTSRLEMRTVRVMTAITSKLISFQCRTEREFRRRALLRSKLRRPKLPDKKHLTLLYLHLQAVRSRLKLFRVRPD